MSVTDNRKRRSYEKSFTQYDYVLLFMTIGISLFGVLMIYSAGYYKASMLNSPFRFVSRQLMGLGMGCCAMFMISFIDHNIYIYPLKKGKYTISFAHIIYVLALVLQIAVLVIGDEHNGAKRWISFGPVQFQPSEISKIAVIMFVAYAIYKNRAALDSFLGFISIMFYVAPFIVLIAMENLSSAIIVGGISVGMCFVASRKRLYFLGCFIAMLGIVWAYINLGEGFRMKRIDIWRNVETHPDALQIRQGLYAVASGGPFGKGLGRSMQKLGYIPEAYNDMIFAVICEELGIVGAVILVLAFLVLIWRIIIISCRAPDLYGTMLCTGVMIQLAIQLVINIAVVTNTIPSTGIPLPFVSYGGTSAAIMMAEMGLVLGVSRRIKQK